MACSGAKFTFTSRLCVNTKIYRAVVDVVTVLAVCSSAAGTPVAFIGLTIVLVIQVLVDGSSIFLRNIISVTQDWS